MSITRASKAKESSQDQSLTLDAGDSSAEAKTEASEMGACADW
jgi:hypothetical protein